MGTAGAKGFGDTLLVNKTLKTLDVSDNSFGKPVVGDQVKMKSSGEMKIVTDPDYYGGIQVQGSDSHIEPSEFELMTVLALCAGVAASPSLISVSTTLRHACTSCFLSHSSPHSSMYIARCFRE